QRSAARHLPLRRHAGGGGAGGGVGVAAGPPGRARGRPAVRERKLVVHARERVADGVIALELRDPAGAELPAWTPGAHLDLLLPNSLVRQYSLCGDPADRTAYRLAVLREPAGRGGSAWIH